MVKTALEVKDFELHSGSHPRVGVVDHICFHRLNETFLEHVARIAVFLAYDVGHNLQGIYLLLLEHLTLVVNVDGLRLLSWGFGLNKLGMLALKFLYKNH